jgi:hypothetical protein
MNDSLSEYDDLAWQAFRYVAGELDGPELDCFEMLLAEDQAAREAVAQAIELSQATAAALDHSPVRRAGSVNSLHSVSLNKDEDGRIGNSSYVNRLAWLAAALAACVLVAIGLGQWSKTPASSAAANSDALAVRWSEVRADQQALWMDDGDTAAAYSDWAENVDSSDQQQESIAVAPEWMLAAVRQQQATGDGDDMPQIERDGGEPPSLQ